MSFVSGLEHPQRKIVPRTKGQNMDQLEILRVIAAAMTIVAASLVAANWSPRVTIAGFVIFVWASILWLIDGWLEGKPSLVIQNFVLLLINIAGVYRWLPKA
jgi:hypothetical protein